MEEMKRLAENFSSNKNSPHYWIDLLKIYIPFKILDGLLNSIGSGVLDSSKPYISNLINLLIITKVQVNLLTLLVIFLAGGLIIYLRYVIKGRYGI